MKTLKQSAIASTKRKNGFLTEMKLNFPLYTMFVPGFILTFLFSYVPLFGVVLAFKQVDLRNGIMRSPWVGTENFRLLFSSPTAILSIRNTLLYNLIFIFSGLVIAVTLAITLSLVGNKLASKAYQTVLIMPHFLSYVIVAYLVYAFLNMETGFVNNQILKMLTGEPQEINWYIQQKAWPYIIFIVHMWKTMGYSSIVYLAAIAGINSELYEAAQIDGANLWKQIIHITLPSLKSMMIIMTILNLGKIFNADFGLFYNVPMNSGALYPVTNVLSVYTYNMMMAAGTASTGLSSAAALFQSAIGFVLVLVTNCIVRKLDSSNALF